MAHSQSVIGSFLRKDTALPNVKFLSWSVSVWTLRIWLWAAIAAVMSVLLTSTLYPKNIFLYRYGIGFVDIITLPQMFTVVSFFVLFFCALWKFEGFSLRHATGRAGAVACIYIVYIFSAIDVMTAWVYEGYNDARAVIVVACCIAVCIMVCANTIYSASIAINRLPYFYVTQVLMSVIGVVVILLLTSYTLGDIPGLKILSEAHPLYAYFSPVPRAATYDDHIIAAAVWLPALIYFFVRSIFAAVSAAIIAVVFIFLSSIGFAMRMSYVPLEEYYQAYGVSIMIATCLGVLVGFFSRYMVAFVQAKRIAKKQSH